MPSENNALNDASRRTTRDRNLEQYSPDELRALINGLRAENSALKLKLQHLEATYKEAQQNIIQRKQTERALQERNRQLELLNRSIALFVSTLDMEQVLNKILGEVRKMLGVAGYSVWIIDPETDDLVCWQVPEDQSEVVLGWRLLSGQGVANWVARNEQSVVVPDTRKDPRHFKEIDRRLGLETRSILSVPLKGKNGPLGALQVVDTRVDRFNEADQQMLETLAAAAAIAIENAQLYEQAREDAETKAMLLREINHRVKNNLTVVRSMLYLKLKRLAEEEQVLYQSVTKDLINQVQGLAMVHDMLSASGWLPLTLSSLVSQLIDSALDVLTTDQLVSVDVAASPVTVTSDQAHDLVLVVNELVTNSIKYALPRVGQALKLAVTIEVEDYIAVLTYRDNGPGYPLPFDPAHKYSGIELVRGIVNTGLRGDLETKNDGGAITIIRFKIEPHGSEQ